MVLGMVMAAVGGVIKFHTEMIDGYLTPIVKLLPAGGGTGSDVWKLYNMTSVAMIGFGFCTSISGLLGCLVGTCPKRGMLLVYMVVTVITICLQLTASALVLTMNINSDIKEALTSNLVIQYRGDEATDEYSQAWNYVFVEFGCCGVQTYTEFILMVQWNREKVDANGTTYIVTVPVTCCKLPGSYPDIGEPYSQICTTDPTTENSYYIQNCYEKIQEYLHYYGILMSCVYIGTVVFETVCLSIAVSICVEMKRETYRMKQALNGETRNWQNQ